MRTSHCLPVETPTGAQAKATAAQVAATAVANSHKARHEPGGADALTLLTSANFAAANVDGVAGTASLRTLGTGAQQAAAGDHGHLMYGVFGDGVDAAVDFDGITAYAGFSGLVGSTYTLTRDVLATSITVRAGVTVCTAGFRIYATGTTTVEATGVIHNNGAAAVAGAAGAAAAGGTLTASVAGGAGGTAGGAGAAGTAVAASAFGGAGGAGGAAAAGGAGGAGGAVTAPTAIYGGLQTARVLQSATCGTALTAGAVRAMATGAGGGGGGADGANAGGGGGGGGGVVIVNTRLLVNAGTITATGGAGAAGTAGNAGGGGGGGGGLVIINTTGASGAGTVTAAGGALGVKAGTGADGAAGSAGLAITNVWA